MALLGYARVSTPDQSLDLQTDALTVAGCDRVWTDTASGKSLRSRPGLDALLDHARDGDTLVVWRLDRLGRALDVGVLLDDLQERRGIGFQSLTEGFDTTTATGRLLVGIMLAVARAEREVMVERTHAGLAAARARGRTGGRPTVMTPERARVALRMLDAGATVTDVAAALGVGRSSVARWLAAREDRATPADRRA